MFWSFLFVQVLYFGSVLLDYMKNKFKYLVDNRFILVSLLVSVLFLMPILWQPSFGPIDDYRIYRLMDLSWSQIWNEHVIDMIASKRFIVLNLIDQWFYAQISTSAVFFYLVLLFIALSGVIALYFYVNRYAFSKNIAYLFIPLILLSIIFTDNFYRLATAEKYLFLLIPLFLYFATKYILENKFSSLILALVFANIAIYQKEIIFILFFAFGSIYAFLLFFNKKSESNYKRLLMLNLLIVLSSVAFLLLYYLFIYSKSTNAEGFGNIYGMSIASRVLTAIKVYKAYCINSPIIALLLPAVILTRLFLYKKINAVFAERKRQDLLCFYDALLLSSFVYIVFVCLTAQGSFGRYLLPALLFSFVPLIEYSVVLYQTIKQLYLKFAFFLILLLSCFNSSVYGVNWAIGFKADAYSMKESLEQVKEQIAKHKYVNVYLADREPYRHAEFYIGYGEYLKKQLGVSAKSFDLKALIINPRNLKQDYWIHDKNSKGFDVVNYRALQSNVAVSPQMEDIIILSNLNFNNLKREIVLETLRKKNLKYEKFANNSQVDIYSFNPISVGVLIGRKPFIKKTSMLNDVYIVKY